VRDLVHERRRQRERAQDDELTRAIANLFFELALGAFEQGFAGIDAPARQPELIPVQPRRVFAREQHRIAVEHRHDDRHLAPTAGDPLIGPALTIGELQIHLFDLVARLNQTRGVNQRQGLHIGWSLTAR